MPGGEIHRHICSCFTLAYARKCIGRKTQTWPESWIEISWRQAREMKWRTVPGLVIRPPNRRSIPVSLIFVSKVKEA